ncbi:hypothetical protein [Luteimicrobium sp. DT211]|uniref:hypothetical protein n=1 Tax=Luteimicrobium sp. DT211 TaxID=3393412 RepID=UPI003CEA2618
MDGTDDPGYLHAPGTTNVVRSPDGTTTLTVWECLRRPLASGLAVRVYGGPESGSPAGGLDVRLSRAAQSSRIYWATWKLPSRSPNGAYDVTALVLRGSTAVDEFDGGFVVRRATRLRLDAGPEPARPGGRVTVRVRAAAATATGSAWAPFAERHVKLYFDPEGSAPSRLVRTVATGAKGLASTSFPARRGGTWVAKFGGTSEYFAPSTSNRDHVAFVRK